MKNRIGAVAVHLSYRGLERAFVKARDLGLDGIEWFESYGRRFRDGRRIDGVRKLSKKYGIEASFHAPYVGRWDIGRLPPEEGCERVGEMLRKCARFGAHCMTLHLGSFSDDIPREKALHNAVESISGTVSVAHRLKIRICVENSTCCHNPNDLGVRTGDFEILFERTKSHVVGLCLDVGHANITGNLYDLIKKFGPRLYNVHLHDSDGTNDNHLAPGEGTIDWDRFFCGLIQAGYKGPFTFEFPEKTGFYPAFMEKIRAFEKYIVKGTGL